MDSAAPPKPWERGGGALYNQENGLPTTGTNSLGLGGNLDIGTTGVVAPQSKELARPPIPPRPSEQRPTYGGSYGHGSGFGSSYGGYGGYGSYGTGSGLYGNSLFGSGYGSGMYGGGYAGGMGGYGGIGRYGMNEPMPDSFAQRAEADARHAFQSIESVVQVFGSVAMMLESTYNAVYSSFRAVIGVADHFSRLKMHMAQIFSAIAVVKTLRWLFRKLMVLLRLRNPSELDENLWQKAATEVLPKELGELEGSPSKWPVFLFFAMIFGGPWLIWKFLSAFMKEKVNSDWANGNGDHFVALAAYDFTAESDEEITVRKGQQLRIAPKDLQPRIRGWLLGSVDGVKKGLVPAEYIKIKGKQRGKNSPLNEPRPLPIPPGTRNTGTGSSEPNAEWTTASQSVANETEESFKNAFSLDLLRPIEII